MSTRFSVFQIFAINKIIEIDKNIYCNIVTCGAITQVLHYLQKPGE